MPISGRQKSSYQIIITFSPFRLGSGAVEGFLLTNPLAQQVLQKAAKKLRSHKLTVINCVMWKDWGMEGKKEEKWKNKSVSWMRVPKCQHTGIYLVADAHTVSGRREAQRACPASGLLSREPARLCLEYLLKVTCRICQSWWACN